MSFRYLSPTVISHLRLQYFEFINQIEKKNSSHLYCAIIFKKIRNNPAIYIYIYIYIIFFWLFSFCFRWDNCIRLYSFYRDWVRYRDTHRIAIGIVPVSLYRQHEDYAVLLFHASYSLLFTKAHITKTYKEKDALFVEHNINSICPLD